MSTALERVDQRPVSIFPGVTADEILATATDVANKFSDVVKQRRMFKRIGESDHIQIEAWQTIGALTGVAAVEGDGVEQLPWPDLEPLAGEPPPLPGREPRRDSPEYRQWKAADTNYREWELHRDLLHARAIGRAYGFKASFRAVKGGIEVGWGEGRCTRGEASKVAQEDYALASMAQTRAQSRALGAPLRFVVKLAGYEGGSAEEIDGAGAPADTAALEAAQKRVTELETQIAAGGGQWGPVATDDQENQAAEAVKRIAPGVPAEQFVLLLGQGFDGVPVAVVKALTGLAKYIAASAPPENAPPDQSAYHDTPGAPA